MDFGHGIIYSPKTDKFHYVGNLDELKLNAPLTVVVELLYDCNLSCGFCMKLDDVKRIPSYDESASYLDKLSFNDHPIRTVISGGEPFLRKDIERVLQHGHSKGHIQNLATNGILVNPNKSLVECVNVFEVGLDGNTSETYKSVRGSDGYDAVVANIQKLTDLGANVRVTYLLTKKNASSAKEMPELCSRLGVSKLRLQRFIRYGRGAKNYQEFELSDEELHRVVEETKDDASRFGIELRTPPAKQYYYGVIFITPQGDIMYRNGSGDEDSTRRLGNLKETDLSEVWTPEMSDAHKKIIFFPDML